MGKYIRKFDNYTDANNDSTMDMPLVKGIDGVTDHVLYEDNKIDYYNQYLTISHGLGTGTLTLKYTKDDTITGSLYYSVDGTTWTELTSTGASFQIDNNTTSNQNIINIFLKGNLSPSLSGKGIGHIDILTPNNIFEYISIYGNIMSLCYGDNFRMHEGCNEDYYFYELFKNNDVTNNKINLRLKNLILPRTVSKYCFYRMFYDYADITSLPQLPATILAEGCYQEMFANTYSNISSHYGGTLSLTLPAKYVNNNAYTGMLYRVDNSLMPYDITLECSDFENEDSIRIFGLVSGQIYNTSIVNTTYLNSGVLNDYIVLESNISIGSGTDKKASLDYYIVDESIVNKLLKIYIVNENTLKNRQYHLKVTLTQSVSTSSSNSTNVEYTIFDRQENEFELMYDYSSAKNFTAQLIDSNTGTIISELTNITLPQTFIYSSDYVQEPRIDIINTPSAKYPFKVRFVMHDNTRLANSTSRDILTLKYNISNYPYILNESFAENSNNLSRNYLTYTVRNAQTTLNNSYYEIEDSVLDSLQIDSTKPIYVKAVLERSGLSGTTEYTYYSDIVKQKIDVNDLYKNQHFGVSVTSGSIIITFDSSSKLINGYYSFDKFIWKKISSSTQINLLSDKQVYFKAYNSFASQNSTKLFIIAKNDNDPEVTVFGNIQALKYGDNFKDKNDAMHLESAFSNTNLLVSANNLILPTNLVSSCYASMFAGCTNLEYGPELPATTLADSCYEFMFVSCSSLRETPSLPAMTVVSKCYYQMFYGCTSLLKINKIYGNIRYTDDNHIPVGANMFPNNAPNYKLLPQYYASGSDDNVTYDQLIYEDQYLTTELVGDGTVKLVIGANINTSNVENISYVAYSFDGGIVWNKVEVPCPNDQITVETPWLKAGTKVLWKGKALTYCNLDFTEIFNNNNKKQINLAEISELSINANSRYTNNKIANKTCLIDGSTIKVYGNIMSLLYGDDFMYKYEFKANNTFAYLFAYRSNNIQNIEGLCLPAKVLTEGCYAAMFACTNVYNKTPIMKFDELYAFSCDAMFYNSYHITDITYFEVDKLSVYPKEAVCACSNMFMSSNTLAGNSTNLRNALTYKLNLYNVNLKAEYLTSYCYGSMFSGCYISSIPQGFLPSMHLALACYGSMFSYCYNFYGGNSNINLWKLCVNHTNWFEPEDTSLLSWDVIHESRKVNVPQDLLPATELSPTCYSGMFSSVPLLTPPDLPSENLKPYCYDTMFAGCAYMKKAPVLNAKTLLQSCYYSMFTSCLSLEYIEMYAEEDLNNNSLTNWLLYAGIYSNPTSVEGKNILISRKKLDKNKFFTSGNQWWTLSDTDIQKATEANNRWVQRGSKYYNTPLTLKPIDETATTNITITKGASINIQEFYVATHTIGFEATNWGSNLSTAINPSTTITLAPGLELSIKAKYNHKATTSLPRHYSSYYTSTNFRNCIHFDSTNDYEAYGNICSLLNGSSNFYNIETSDETHKFTGLFLNATSTYQSDTLTHLSKADDLYLPLDNLATSVYAAMFANAKIERTPIMDAVSLGPACYSGMYTYCKNLKTSEYLPATTLKQRCYYSMFLGCESLEIAPDLLATSPAIHCYSDMFYKCYNLKYMKCLASRLNTSYSQRYVASVGGEGIFIYNPNISSYNWDDTSNCKPEFFMAVPDGTIPTTMIFSRGVQNIRLSQNTISPPTISLYDNSTTYTNNIKRTVEALSVISNNNLSITETTQINNIELYNISDGTSTSYINTLNMKILYDKIYSNKEYIYCNNKATSDVSGWNFPAIYDQWKTEVEPKNASTSEVKYSTQNINQEKIISISMGGGI